MVRQGQMSVVAVAALDPIFWFHHCNIDRTVAIWQTLTKMLDAAPDRDTLIDLIVDDDAVNIAYEKYVPPSTTSTSQPNNYPEPLAAGGIGAGWGVIECRDLDGR
ncbi:hypothetical protein B0H67DRAFT_660350 [Lasiosphaeris hirsuta]|uniref:Tyrosinase copper-binding domain-containing protein n=1 Tax=Lasiosphaeris hirsuta TaxID=260670 RepID=A0AA40B1W8_9PEZI|nr:hypothetical protein B0H67DRAFT_660350 [Lasiosphaeris hirsuta]